MNIESKSRAGFTSIMLRGGRMTKWKGQVASYAPQVGQLQSVSVAAMAAALALGGTVAMPSEAFAQDVTVVVDTLPPPPAIAAPPVDETNNGNGASLTINATVPVAGGSSQAGITATNGANATDITINATTVSGTSGIVVNNDGSGATTINANVISGATFDGVNIQTGGNGIDISADQISGDNRAVVIDHQGSGDINIDAGSLTGNEENIAQINLGENAGNVNILIGSAGGLEQGIVLDSISTGGSIDLAVTGNVVVQRGESFAGTGVDAAINSTLSQGDISISTNNVSAINGIIAANAGTGSIDVQSAGLVLGAGGGGIQATQLGDGQGITVNANDIIANDFGINVVMSDGQGNIDISANEIKAINVGVEGFDPLLPIAATAGQVGVLVSATSQNAGEILVNVPNITAGTGIEIVNSGDGAALVESFGQILALAGDGVSVTQNGLGAGAGTSGTAGVNDGITINLASVGAYGNGVVANMSSGQGGIDISADLVTASLTGVSVSATSANAGNILVNVTDVQAGTGIEIVNSGEGYALVQSLGQILTTSGDAINVTQNGNGAGITIEASEIFTSDFGIRANLQSGTGDINVTAANIDAGATAIEARNEGVSDGTNGNIDIAVSGNLISATGDGVSAYNGEDARALKISVNNVKAFEDGINAENRGTNDTEIVAAGTIEARNYGIRAYNADTAGNLKVTANIVTSGDALDPNNPLNAGNAIFAQNFGNGDTEIILNGAVTAHGGEGIKALNGANAGDITITTADVTARDNAVLAYAYGDGANISITTNGTIAAGARYGIRGVNGGNLGGDVTIVANDDVVGNLGAIAAVNGGVGDINITSRAKLESTGASTFAVAAANVDRAGDINLQLNDVTGVRAAVAVFNFGDSVVLRSTGKLSGLGTGLGEGAGVGVLNAAGTESVTLDVTDVEATLDDAIVVDNQGTGFTSVSASGTVTGGTAGDGIDVTHAGVDQNLTISATKLAVADANGVVAATVSGGVNGIIAVNNGTNAATTVTALGKTVGATGAGISVTNNAGATDLAITANVVEGATQGILAVNNGTGNTSVAVTSSVTGGSASYGISAYNGEYAGNLIINAGNVTGGFGGIGAENLGTGVTTITVSGTVVGENFSGITAYNGEYTGGTAALGTTAGTGLTIVATKVSDVIAGVLVPTISGSNNGIYAANFGAGATTLDIAGKVVGVNGDGIFVENGANSLGVSINVAAVSGGDDGIDITNNGVGATLVTATGDVTGTDEGIFAVNGTTATDLTVDAVNVGGGEFGIFANNAGSGSTTVRSTGVVDGQTQAAISAINAATALNLTVEANEVTGATFGVIADNQGRGATNVSVANFVSGGSEDAIRVTNGALASDLNITAKVVEGAKSGVVAVNNGTGNTTLTLGGNVTGGAGFNAVDVTNAATAKDVTINATNAAATITGGNNGIVVINDGVGGSTTVAVAGTVTGTTNDGINVLNGQDTVDLTIRANIVSGAEDGIQTINNGVGATLVAATDVTAAAGFGIEVVNAATASNLTVNAGKVTGGTGAGADGISVTNAGRGFTLVTATGDVTGTDEGIFAVNGTTATDLTVAAVNVGGGEFGIFANNAGSGSTTVRSTGVVDGQTQAAISAINAATALNLTVEANEVTGATFGVIADNQGRGATNVSVANFVSGGSEDAIRVTNGALASDLNITAKVVEGAKSGVVAVNNGTGNTTLTLGGNVTGGAGFNAVDVTNAATAKDMTINATNAAATITGGDSGILAINNSTNGGSTFIDVKGKVVGTTGDGIRAENAAGSATANLTVLAHDVNGGEQGIIALNYGSGATTVTSTGTVTGLNEDGIFVYSGGAGDITVQAVNANGKDGIDVTNYGQGSSSKITVTGDVVGNEAFGFFASNGTYNGKSAYNLTAEVSNVTGQIDAIHLVNEGTGSIDLTVNGTVLSETENGIYARVDTSAKNLKVTGTNAAATITGNVNGIFAVNDSSNGGTTSIDVKSKVVGVTEEGIKVAIGEGAGNLSVTVHDVKGNTRGIYSYNEGTGSTVIVSTGLVEALTRDGILAVVRGNAGKLSISANNVEADGEGIDADNLGTGSTSITATGLVKGGGIGIFAYNGATTDNLSISANNVEGGREGVGAKNYGSGNTTVTLNGNVTGGAGFNAVDVTNAATAKNLTITGNNAAATITGGVNGILAVNNGVGGSTSVSDLGTVQGETASGIDATNEVDALNLTVAANNVKGATNGVTALNKGQGNTTVALAGNATGGTAGFGLLATNAASAKDLTITASGVAAKIVGGLDGISTVNNGGSSTSITTKGDVVGTSRTGINARNATTTVDLKIDANNVSGTDFGVFAINEGKGSNSITVTGNAVGSTKSGVKAYNAASATTLTVSVKNVTGGIDGLDVVNEGSGASTVSISGKVVGGTGVGLASASKAGNLTTINLAATADVSATSGNAILNNGGNSVLNVANGAGLRGTVRLGDGSDTANFALASTEAFIGITALDGGDNVSAADGFVDTLNLNGVGNYDLVGARVTNWEAININAGTVGFSDAAIVTTDLTVNAGGTLNAANSLVATANVTVAANGTLQAGNAAGNSRTRIVGNLASAGLVNLSGPAGSAKAGDTLAVTGNFTGNGGQVRLDTVLGGDNSPTDLVSISGNAVGGSLLAINNTGGFGGLTTGDGIRVVQVGGTSDRGAFALLGDNVQAGGFRYDLFLGGIADPNDQDWYLRTVGASDIAATTLSFARLSDDIAMTFLGTLHERVGEQEHLAKRGYQSAGTGGLWGRFVGKGFRERLSSATLGDIKSTGSIAGLQMGLDFGRSIKSDGSATFTGAYAGYADGSSNDQNIFRNVARRSGSSDSKGWLTGLYATHYGSTGWYANAVVQATWVDASASARNGVTLETDGRTYLGSVELGKSLKLGNRLAFETQAQLIYGETRFDDARDSAGIANKIRIEDSLTGRVGFRLKTTKDEKYNAAGGLFSGYLKANLWHNLLGSDVRLNTAGVDLGKFEPKKTWVDAGLGTTLTVAKNTELFFDADVEIGLDRKTAAGTGKAGLRINW